MLSVLKDFTPVCTFQKGRTAQQRRFPGAGRADDGDDITTFYRERNILQYGKRSKRLLETAYAENAGNSGILCGIDYFICHSFFHSLLLIIIQSLLDSAHQIINNHIENIVEGTSNEKGHEAGLGVCDLLSNGEHFLIGNGKGH